MTDEVPDTIKLLHGISSVDPRGGTPVEGNKQRSTDLAAHGHTVELLSLDVPNAARLEHFPCARLLPALSGWAATTECHVSRAGYWPPGQYDHIVTDGLWQYRRSRAPIPAPLSGSIRCNARERPQRWTKN